MEEIFYRGLRDDVYNQTFSRSLDGLLLEAQKGLQPWRDFCMNCLAANYGRGTWDLGMDFFQGFRDFEVISGGRYIL